MLVRGSIKICSFFLFSFPPFFFFFYGQFLVSWKKTIVHLSRTRLLSRDGMASDPVQANPHLSMRNGCRCVTEPGVSVEEVLVMVGELVGFENILSASRMNKAMVVFLKTEQLVNQLTESGIWIKEMFVPVTPLAAPATKVTISNVPPFISNDAITKNELSAAVSGLASGRTPGIDGLPGEFYKHFWTLIGTDLYEVFHVGLLPKSCQRAVLT